MQSKVATVAEYLASLPADRREAIEAVRKVVLKNIDRTFAEGMQYGGIGYYVPHSVFPPGYHCDPKQPLPYAGLASQKNHMALYMMSLYDDGPMEAWFKKEWQKTGKKLDMGKSCVRFKKIEDVALDVVAEAFKRVTAKEYVAHYMSTMLSMNKSAAKKVKASLATKPATKKASKASPAKKAAPKAAPAKKARAAKNAAAKKKAAKK